MFSVLLEKLQNTGPYPKVLNRSGSVTRLSRRVLIKRLKDIKHTSLKCKTDIRKRGYYMPACGYKFYLRVFNSISHAFAALTCEISS